MSYQETNRSNSVSNLDNEMKLVSITEKLKIQDKDLNGLRKDLNTNIRETIAFKAINRSQNKKSLDKSTNFMDSFQNDLKMIYREICDQIRDERCEIQTLGKKFDLLHDDLDIINKLVMNLDERIKVCETDVGIHMK